MTIGILFNNVPLLFMPLSYSAKRPFKYHVIMNITLQYIRFPELLVHIVYNLKGKGGGSQKITVDYLEKGLIIIIFKCSLTFDY